MNTQLLSFGYRSGHCLQLGFCTKPRKRLQAGSPPRLGPRNALRETKQSNAIWRPPRPQSDSHTACSATDILFSLTSAQVCSHPLATIRTRSVQYLTTSPVDRFVGTVSYISGFGTISSIPGGRTTHIPGSCGSMSCISDSGTTFSISGFRRKVEA